MKNHGEKPIRGFGAGGGLSISSRIASNTILN